MSCDDNLMYKNPIFYALGVPKRKLIRDILGEIIGFIMVMVIILAAMVVVMSWEDKPDWDARVKQAQQTYMEKMGER